MRPAYAPISHACLEAGAADAHDARPGGGPGCASSRLRFSLKNRGASISSISGSGKGFGRQDFEGCWHNSITWHSTCAHIARARAHGFPGPMAHGPMAPGPWPHGLAPCAWKFYQLADCKGLSACRSLPAPPTPPMPPWPPSRMAPPPSTPLLAPRMTSGRPESLRPLRAPRPTWPPWTHGSPGPMAHGPMTPGPMVRSSWPQGPWSHDPMPLDPGPIALSADFKERHTCPPAPLFVVGGQIAHHRGFVSLWGPGGRASAASAAPERVSGGRISKDAGITP